jgi:DNA-binding NtrC family response regulator
MLHAQSADDAARAAITLSACRVIALPSISSRHAELEQLIQVCAKDAAAELKAPTTGIAADDIEALSRLSYRGLAELEFRVRRVVAMRAWGVSNGADRLGITHVALLTWARRWNLRR